MARVLAARVNGVLGRYTSRWPVPLARQEHLAQAVRAEVKRKIEEAGSWLKVGLPALRGALCRSSVGEARVAGTKPA
ncbi:hypothetical protein ACTLLP_03500 [Desulfothermobacter acidiphilus]